MVLFKYALAHHNLGFLFSNENFPEFLDYEKASNLGCAISSYNLAYLHESGKGISQNDRKSFDLYSVASKQGDADGLYQVGYRYTYGIGVTKNLEDAFAAFSKAAEQDHAQSIYQLSLLYFYGEGTEKDEVKGLDLMMQAHRKRNQSAEIFINDFFSSKLSIEEFCITRRVRARGVENK